MAAGRSYALGNLSLPVHAVVAAQVQQGKEVYQTVIIYVIVAVIIRLVLHAEHVTYQLLVVFALTHEGCGGHGAYKTY